ncbi:MAG TPA: SUMF1/EgtB/PvdO family nonheme iron enzyme [Verrucomicrobiae bacterium]|nr:SUMF1/EgtB/PvdO family nonheme iron enzyme [Verrucomicrobiae bacterium]
MKTLIHIIRRHILTLLALASFTVSLRAQDVSIPDPNLNAVIRAVLQKPNGPLTQSDMLGLTNLGAVFQNITNLQGLEAAKNLVSLDLQDNRITSVNILTNLTRLVFLDLSENRFPQLAIPGAMTNLTTLRAESGGLTNITLPAGLTKLTSLRLGFNQLPSLTLPADMTNLSVLSVYLNQLTNLTLPPSLNGLTNLNLDGNQLSRLNLPAGLTKLDTIIASANQLTNFTMSADMTNLRFLRLNNNQLTSLNLPIGLTNLTGLFLNSNQLTNLTLPPDLNHLTQIELGQNKLASLTLSAGLTSLAFLNLTDNQLTNLTLPPDVQQLIGLFMGGNPLTTFVLSEPLATTGMASVVDSFRNQDISVFTYPLDAQLVRPLMLIGSFKFGITGPPGVYTVLGSTNLATWSAVGVATNPLGSVNFHDVTTTVLPQKFYRVLLQVPPANMAFIPPNTFTMGTPTNEANRGADEGPQMTVTITRGFWIGKYEVTQREYQAVIGSNPSQFPGDLNRPVETVSWLDATNYCAKLTQQELAAGRIPPGSHYRLPTEAEWECAARAGTSTRFSYGDDPNFTELANHAWYWFNSDVATHPVGQKAPNPWGLYDMEGNVWEWTQDWYGQYHGGAITDPQGPVSNSIGVKVIRGGAWDAGESNCRSGRRQTEGVHPFITDYILGFRVVLVTEP